MALPAAPSDINTYGGIMSNYGGLGVQDPTTDQDAGAWNQAANDIGMMTRMCPRASLSFLGSAAPPLVANQAMWGVGTPPVIARSVAGTYTATFPATIIDQLGVSQTLNLQGAHAVLELGFGEIRAEITGANVVTIYTATLATTTLADLSMRCKVWVY